ncbi:MAG: ABC transporter ATP-binding protein [Ruminococcaceae bacterium]|nr:ABC transporter ATP-binding protein [Oscillospiraceae bacterium]
MLQIENLTKTYKGSGKGVKNLTLSLSAGDIYGFIGHNGAGKTTTLKCIAGILDFKEGKILVDGHSVKEEDLLCKSMIAYIPDNPDLPEYLTGIQYLNFISDIYGLSKETRMEKIKKYTGMFEITDALGDLISSYSHGMKQKLALVSAWIRNPKLMLLDEPFVGLDPKAAHILKELMRELCREGGAVFFSTHVLDVAEKLCNRVAIIKGGELIAAGDIATLTHGDSLENVFMEMLKWEE